LRDVLVSFPGCGTWPCDEINYIWRHGNAGFPSDEFSVDMARPSVARYIRSCFERLARKKKINTIIEKTCANSLRVEFIDKIFPKARYIYIVRDGLDTVASAKKRWQAKLDVLYLLRKARYVPVMDFPYYVFRYAANRLYRFFSREQRVAFWGPSFSGLDVALRENTLDEVCALQWRRCVDRADEAFQKIDPKRVCRVSYEAFVTNPAGEVERIVEFMGGNMNSLIAENSVRDVSAASVGKGRRGLERKSIERLRGILGSTLSRHGYIN